MKDYTNLGLNERLQKNSSLAVKRQPLIKGVEFDQRYEIQTRDIKASLVHISNEAASIGTVSNGTHIVYTTTLSPELSYQNSIIAGWVSEEIYQGTVAIGSMMIFPAPGSGIAADSWRSSSGYRQLGGSEINHRFQVMIYNNTGATGTVIGISKWKYIQNGGGKDA